MSSVMSTASWVIVDINTGKAVCELFNPVLVRAINTKKYRALPILEWLGSLNHKMPWE